MKLRKVLGLSSALCLGALPLAAQETNNVEQLKKQLQELQQKLQKQQAAQRQQTEALQKQLEALLLQQHNPEQAASTNQSRATDPAPAGQSPSPPADQPWSPSHSIPRVWEFVDQPLVLNRAFGPDGLRNIGGQLSWLLPTPFYTEVFLGVLNGQGGTAFSFRNLEVDGNHGRTPIDRGLRGPGDLLYVPRIASSFDLTDQQTLVVGASAAFGPNDSGPHSRTEVYGVDGYWKWKSAHANQGFPFVSLQAEALYERFGAGEDVSAGLSAEDLRDWGFYSQLLWGLKPRWVAGLRGEFVTGNDGAFDASDIFRGDRTRVSPNLTWYPSEFSKVRLQYNYDHGQLFGDDHSVWMQVEFLLGSHAAHKF